MSSTAPIPYPDRTAPTGEQQPWSAPQTGGSNSYPAPGRDSYPTPSYGYDSYPTPGAPRTPAPEGSSQGSPTPPHGPEQGRPTPSGRGPRRPRTVLTAVTAAVLAAALASGTTAYLVRDDGPATSADGGLTQVQGISASVDGSPDWQAVASAVSPSVVAIDVQMAQGEAAGSGVVLDTDGHVLTNNHVVDGAQQVQVMLADGRRYAADVVGTDPTTDLAVLRIADPPEDLTPAQLGTSGDLAVGEDVMAVGNPLGLDNTVTTGIVSALDRPVTASSQSATTTSTTNAIQIDAAINPGNSGGPLFDAQGLVIGITSSIATLSGGGESGSIGLGFAIPIDLAAGIADQLIADGVAEHAYLGVTLQEGEGSADGVTRQGAEVVEVVDGTPAAEAGLQPGDVIVGIDDHAVGSAEALTGFVRTYGAGDDVTLSVIRDGAGSEVTVTLATREES